MLNITSSLARRQSVSKKAHIVQRSRAFSESRSRSAILMPAMSPFLNEATVTRWRKKEGEAFVAGESLVEIESDIATIEIVAENPGIIGQILIPDGTENVAVERVMATVAKNAEEIALWKQQTRAIIGTPPPPPLASPSMLRTQYMGPASAPPRVVRPSTPSHRVEQHLLSAMDHRPSSELQQLHTMRGMATGSPGAAPSSPASPSSPSIGSCAYNDGAMLRRKIAANMAQSSGFGPRTDQGRPRSTTSEYFEGII